LFTRSDFGTELACGFNEDCGDDVGLDSELDGSSLCESESLCLAAAAAQGSNVAEGLSTDAEALGKSASVSVEAE
jgi:hypothetical protein